MKYHPEIENSIIKKSVRKNIVFMLSTLISGKAFITYNMLKTSYSYDLIKVLILKRQ